MLRRANLCFIVATFVCVAIPALASVIVPYRGSLKKAGEPFTGTAKMKFAIVENAAVLWSNDPIDNQTQAPRQSVVVKVSAGSFAVSLGAQPMLPLDNAVFEAHPQASLRVWVSTGGVFEQLSDQAISSVLSVEAQGGPPAVRPGPATPVEVRNLPLEVSGSISVNDNVPIKVNVNNTVPVTVGNTVPVSISQAAAIVSAPGFAPFHKVLHADETVTVPSGKILVLTQVNFKADAGQYFSGDAGLVLRGGPLGTETVSYDFPLVSRVDVPDDPRFTGITVYANASTQLYIDEGTEIRGGFGFSNAGLSLSNEKTALSGYYLSKP